MQDLLTFASDVARLVLAAVFAIAAVAKLRDRGGVTDTVLAFAVPARLAHPVAVALPAAELYVAVLLVIPGLARWGAVGAALLIAMFTVAIALSLARGSAADCHCFGQLRASRVTSATLARNLTLLVLAVFVAVTA